MYQNSTSSLFLLLNILEFASSKKWIVQTFSFFDKLLIQRIRAEHRNNDQNLCQMWIPMDFLSSWNSPLTRKIIENTNWISQSIIGLVSIFFQQTIHFERFTCAKKTLKTKHLLTTAVEEYQ